MSFSLFLESEDGLGDQLPPRHTDRKTDRQTGGGWVER